MTCDQTTRTSRRQPVVRARRRRSRPCGRPGLGRATHGGATCEAGNGKDLVGPVACPRPGGRLVRGLACADWASRSRAAVFTPACCAGGGADNLARPPLSPPTAAPPARGASAGLPVLPARTPGAPLTWFVGKAAGRARPRFAHRSPRRVASQPGFTRPSRARPEKKSTRRPARPSLPARGGGRNSNASRGFTSVLPLALRGIHASGARGHRRGSAGRTRRPLPFAGSLLGRLASAPAFPAAPLMRIADVDAPDFTTRSHDPSSRPPCAEPSQTGTPACVARC